MVEIVLTEMRLLLYARRKEYKVEHCLSDILKGIDETRPATVGPALLGTGQSLNAVQGRAVENISQG